MRCIHSKRNTLEGPMVLAAGPEELDAGAVDVAAEDPVSVLLSEVALWEHSITISYQDRNPRIITLLSAFSLVPWAQNTSKNHSSPDCGED